MNKKNVKRKRFHNLNDISTLNLGIFIVKSEMEKDVGDKINGLGGRVLSSVRAEGGFAVSRFLDIFSNIKSDHVVIFSAIRSEDAKNIIEAIGTEFNFDVAGNGKAFAVDVEGFMGAKGPFLK